MANFRTNLMIWKDRFHRRIFGDVTDVPTTWRETPKKLSETKDFLDWFDASDSVEATLKRAEGDWKHRFVEFPYFKSVNKGSALEIGFGAGRLLLQSSRSFKKVFGVDIHQAFDRTTQFLNEYKAGEFELVHRDSLAQIPDGSLDFVYSFIVIQHFDSTEELWFYFGETWRLLAPGGFAHLYFGKNSKPGVKVTSAADFTLRDASLFVHPDVIRNKSLQYGFEIVELRERLPKNPVDNTGESMQACIVVRKPLSS